MKNKVYFSDKLNQHYRHCEGGIVFEDKVTYTDEEIKIIKDSSFDVNMIHNAKKYFQGTIITKEQQDELTERYEKNGSPIDKAVEMASQLIRAGIKGHLATHKAAQKYNIAAKAIGHELGQRRKAG